MFVPEVIACKFCGRTGPTAADGLIVTVDDVEVAARRVGWHREADGWICSLCAALMLRTQLSR